jgi:hypothetical protein
MKRTVFVIVVGMMTASSAITIKSSSFAQAAAQNVALKTHDVDSTEVNAKSFGAVGNGRHDDWPALQAMANYMISHAVNGILPIGIYRTTHPIYFINNDYAFFTTTLAGIHSAKTGSQSYLSEIRPDFTDSAAIFIQNARQMEIKNLSIRGKFGFPNRVTPENIFRLKYADWKDGICKDTRTMPYSGICIDPFDAPGGTSGLLVQDCAVKNFVVDIIVSPSGRTAQAEMLNFIDDDIELCKIGIAICQDQSKELHVIRLKDWGSTHTVIDCTHYGAGIGTMPFVDGMNLAGNIYQIFNCPSLGRFTGSANEIYAESIFKIGIIGGNPTPTISNSTFDFDVSGPSADYILLGDANFSGCQFRRYNGTVNRFLLTNFTGTFRDGMMETPPIITGIYNSGYGVGAINFDNVSMYALTGSALGVPKLGRGHTHRTQYKNQYRGDPLWRGNSYLTSDSGRLEKQDDYETISYIGNAMVTVDTLAWKAKFILSGAHLKPGDYVLIGGGQNMFYDTTYIRDNCHTIIVGRVISVIGNSYTLDQPGLNLTAGQKSLYVSRYSLLVQ